jgi:hypothetical protein
MYVIKNTVTDMIIGKFKTDAEFTHFMRRIAVENDDAELSITCLGEAMDYLNNYCSNLKLLDPSEDTYTISLTFTDIQEKTPLDAVKKIIGWVKDDGVDSMTFDVTNEMTGEKFSVDVGEEEEDAVLPDQANQDLVDTVLEQIKKDVASGDVTAIDELLKFIPEKYLIAYLPEKK